GSDLVFRCGPPHRSGSRDACIAHGQGMWQRTRACQGAGHPPACGAGYLSGSARSPAARAREGVVRGALRCAPGGGARRFRRFAELGRPVHPMNDRVKTDCECRIDALESFEIVDSEDPLAVLNQLKVVVLATHLGDNRSLVLPVAHTIYYEMGPTLRKQMGIA